MLDEIESRRRITANDRREMQLAAAQAIAARYREALENVEPLLILAAHEANKVRDHEFVARLDAAIAGLRAALAEKP